MTSPNKSPERQFYHDIANLLAIAKGMSELALSYVSDQSNVDVDKCKDKLGKTVAALDRMEFTMKEFRRLNPVAKGESEV